MRPWAEFSKVVDGDTFDVTLESHDSRTSEDHIRIRLADIDIPERQQTLQ
jgi:endonuclease YncB( thermonuclease family)